MTYTIQENQKTIVAFDLYIFGLESHFELVEPRCGFSVMDENFQVVKNNFTTRQEAENYCQEMGYLNE